MAYLIRDNGVIGETEEALANGRIVTVGRSQSKDGALVKPMKCRASNSDSWKKKNTKYLKVIRVKSGSDEFLSV